MIESCAAVEKIARGRADHWLAAKSECIARYMSVPHIEAIFIASSAGESMQRVAEVEALAGRGLAGDRYAIGTGYYTPRNVCQVTLIEAEALERMLAKGVSAASGEHRRNLVTRGIQLEELRGRRFTVGAAVLEYDRTRPPCAYLERLTQPGMTRAMGEGAGICVSVVESGGIREGDPIVLLPTPAARPLRRLP
jgi:MOSC domain-containing protein YiiM